MKSITKYLLSVLLLVAIAIGVIKLSKKPRWIMPQELNLTKQTQVLAKVKELPTQSIDSKKDLLHLLAKPSRVLIVKVPKDAHPVALQVAKRKVVLKRIAPDTYQSEPIDVEGKEVKATLIFPPRLVYKLPPKALHFDKASPYVIAKEGNSTKKEPILILKKSATYYLVAGKLHKKKVALP